MLSIFLSGVYHLLSFYPYSSGNTIETNREGPEGVSSPSVATRSGAAKHLLRKN